MKQLYVYALWILLHYFYTKNIQDNIKFLQENMDQGYQLCKPNHPVGNSFVNGKRFSNRINYRQMVHMSTGRKKKWEKWLPH